MCDWLHKRETRRDTKEEMFRNFKRRKKLVAGWLERRKKRQE